MAGGAAQLIIVDRELGRRAARAEALRARGLLVHEADDTVGALRELPRLNPDVLVLSGSDALDLDTLARGVRSMPASEHLQILLLGEAPPLGGDAQTLVTRLAADADLDSIVREAERLAGRARRKKQG